MCCNYEVVINYWSTKTHLILSLILHEFQQQSISVTVWTRSGSASGSTERSVQLDACHSLYSPGLLWGFPSLPVIPSKFAFLYPAFGSVSSSGLSISGCSLGCRFSAYGQVLCTWFTHHAYFPCALWRTFPARENAVPGGTCSHSGVQRCHSVMGSHSMVARFLCLLVNFPNEFSWWSF